MAHEMWELKQKQSLPLKAKIQMTITRVREWYEYWINKGEDVYLSWSGGKDSTVLKHIIDTNLPYYHIKSVYVDTGLEYPEIREFVKKDPEVLNYTQNNTVDYIAMDSFAKSVAGLLGGATKKLPKKEK